MKRKAAYFFLFIILLLTIILQISLFWVSDYRSYDSYFILRQVEHVRETGLPLVHDSLSYQGRTHPLSFIFPYVATLLSLVISSEWLFLLLRIFFSVGLLLLLYILILRLYQRNWIAVTVTLLAATSALFFSSLEQTIGSTQLFLLVYLGLLIALLHLEKQQAQFTAGLLLVVLAFTNPLSLFLLPAIIVYLLLLELEGLQQRNEELELLGFGFLFIIWYHLLVYKKALLISGSQVIWQSIPQVLLAHFFTKLSLPLFIQLIGFIPLFLGLYGAYEGLFIVRKRSVLFLIAATISSTGLLLIGALPLIQGLLITVLHLLLLSGYGLLRIASFLNKTRFKHARVLFTGAICLLTVLFFLPVLVHFQSPTGVSVDEQQFLSSLTLTDATILGDINQGHAISYYTKQKNFYDTAFLFAPLPNQRFIDATTIFQAKSVSKIVELTDYYHITHIYVSPELYRRYPYPFFFFEQDTCFDLIAQDGPYKLYEITCTLNN